MARILYPIKVEPVVTTATPEPVTESRWHQPLTEPTRRRALPVAVVVAGLTWCPQPVPTVTPDQFQRPFSEPVRERTGLHARQQQATAFTPAAPFAESVTVDRWLYPLAEPRRSRPALDAAQQQALVRSPYLVPVVDAAVGFYGAFPDRAPGRTLATAQHQATAFVQASPFTETVTADRWAQPPSQPTRRITSVASHQAVIIGTSLPVVASADRWWRPLAEPTRRITSVAGQLAATRSTEPVVASPDRWMQAFGQTRRAKTNTPVLPPALFVPVVVPPVPVNYWYAPFSEPQRHAATVVWHGFAWLIEREPDVDVIIDYTIVRVTMDDPTRLRVRTDEPTALQVEVSSPTRLRVTLS